jgi:hypothetical protein
MPILIAAVAVVGAICLVDLLLTFGVIRRLREHTGILAGSSNPGLSVTGLTAGQSPADFSAVTITGELVTGARGLRMVAFLSSGCSVCPEQVPPFVQYVTSHNIGKDNVLAVIQGGEDEPPPYLNALAEVAHVSFEPAEGEAGKAFRITGFPAFFLLDADGAMTISGYAPSALPEPAAA